MDHINIKSAKYINSHKSLSHWMNWTDESLQNSLLMVNIESKDGIDYVDLPKTVLSWIS